MKFADAFANEVKSVHLYAFNSDNILVWQNVESGSALASGNYFMPLTLEPGNYHLVAWCGLDNENATSTSFSVGQATVGVTTLSQLKCRLNTKHDATGNAYVDTQLTPLFHGDMDVTLPDTDNGETYTYTMSLTKDTNSVSVILQHLSGESVDVNDFEFTIDCDNGSLDYDNTVLDNENICYTAWEKMTGMASLDSYTDTSTNTTTPSFRTVEIAIANLSVARLTPNKKCYLTIKTAEGQTAARIPLTDYALLLRNATNAMMDDQEYLDRQDEYALTFFLDESQRWISTSIIINSWRLVLSDIDIE